MTDAPLHLDRRHFLVGSAAVAAGTAVGCRQDSEPVAAESQDRRDVPIRLVMTGDEKDAEAIRRGWGAVTDQPINIQAIQLDRGDAASLAKEVMEAANTSDLVIYPLAWIPQASTSEAIVALSESESAQIDDASGNLFAALRSGAARYAGQRLATPLGAALPAMLSVEQIVTSIDGGVNDGPASWHEYDQLVTDAWDGLAGEPSAPGWAGAMYLWRTATEKSWLFHREDFQPLVTNDPYVESLAMMVQTNAKYQQPQQTPDQIWSAVKARELRGGIGFPSRRSRSDGELQIYNLPATSELSKVLLDPFSPVISLSAACRQSTVAKQFIQWISGGEGSETVRQQVAGMTEIRGDSSSGRNVQGEQSNYDQWLAARLKSPVVQPTLQIHEAGRYYELLDQQVRRALQGETTPEKALDAVADGWQAITKEVGVSKQLRAWRRAQGMRI